MYWTMIPTKDDPRQSDTLCEHHALQETNAGFGLVDLGPAFGSMAEAAAILTALTAIGGFEYGISSSEEGECAMCEVEADLVSADSEESA